MYSPFYHLPKLVTLMLYHTRQYVIYRDAHPLPQRSPNSFACLHSSESSTQSHTLHYQIVQQMIDELVEQRLSNIYSQSIHSPFKAAVAQWQGVAFLLRKWQYFPNLEVHFLVKAKVVGSIPTGGFISFSSITYPYFFSTSCRSKDQC